MISYRELSGEDKTEFRKIFSAIPQKIRPPEFQVGLLPEALWNSFLDLTSILRIQFWISKDHNLRLGAGVSPSGHGYIGFFEASLDLTEAQVHSALKQAVDWLKDQGINTIYGPLNINTWFSYRFRVDTHPLKFSWEPTNPPDYPRWWKSFGFRVCERYGSTGLDSIETFHSRNAYGIDKAKGLGYNFRPFTKEGFLAKQEGFLTKDGPSDGSILHSLSMAAFRDNFLFENIRLQEFLQIYIPALQKTDLRFSNFAFVNEKDIAFMFAFSDRPAVNIETQYVVLKTVGVLPEHRGAGLSNALMSLATAEGIKQNIPYIVTALVKVGAASQGYEKKSGEIWRHEYELYEL